MAVKGQAINFVEAVKALVSPGRLFWSGWPPLENEQREKNRFSIRKVPNMEEKWWLAGQIEKWEPG